MGDNLCKHSEYVEHQSNKNHHPRHAAECLHKGLTPTLPCQNNTGIQHHLHIRIYREDSVNGDDFDARSPFSDVARLGRWLMGTQTGLTLGGGGARYTYNTAVSCCGCAAPLLLQSTFHTLTHILPLSTPLTHHSLIHHHSFHPSEDWPTSVCTKLWWKVGCRWT